MPNPFEPQAPQEPAPVANPLDYVTNAPASAVTDFLPWLIIGGALLFFAMSHGEKASRKTSWE